MGDSTRFADTVGSSPVTSDTSAAEHDSGRDATPPITSLLLAWQATGEEGRLERLCVAMLPAARRMIGATLHRLGIHDPAASDEALSLVLDHLRRMPGVSTTDRAVSRFVPQADMPSGKDGVDSGLAFILWLSRERAADIARACRRRSSHAVAFSEVDRQETRHLHASAAVDDGEGSSADLQFRLHEAIPRLPSRERLVIELLIEGKSQAVIAHVLGACEGTVSRLRTRAIALLRDLLAE